MVDEGRVRRLEEQAVKVSLPFTGRWLARNSPAGRIPSHGSDLFGERYAIDFIAVDEYRCTAGRRDWRTVLATEPPERFFAFGQPILAPAAGTVAAVHDGEPDHVGRRSQLALVPYALGQAGRVREGGGAIAGNHLIVATATARVFITLVHLQRGSIRVTAGDTVAEGQHVASCGNSGNSTQPHVHMQLTDSADLFHARGVPTIFHRFREWPSGSRQGQVRIEGMPAEGSVVEPLR